MRGSLVKRYHNISTIREDTDGRHSFVVAWLCWMLADRQPSVNLLMAALDHDLPEAVNSDVSSASKWLVPEIKTWLEKADDMVREVAGTAEVFPLTADEQLILDFADKLEAIMFCTHELRALGNKQLGVVANRYGGWVVKMIGDNASNPIARRANSLLDEISKLYIQPVTEEDHVHQQLHPYSPAR